MSTRLEALPGTGSPARLRGMSKAHDQTLIALPWRALHQWHAGLQQAFAHIEQDDALRYLAQAIGHLVSIESVMISLERKDQPPLSLYLQGIPEQYRDSVIGRYFSVGYLLDPFCLAVEQGLADLAACPGIGPAVARRVHGHFHPGAAQLQAVAELALRALR